MLRAVGIIWYDLQYNRHGGGDNVGKARLWMFEYHAKNLGLKGIHYSYNSVHIQPSLRSKLGVMIFTDVIEDLGDVTQQPIQGL